MSLDDWAASRWIVQHQASIEEITDLFDVVDRDLNDAAIPRLSADWRLGITYNAALQLAIIALAVSGFRPGRERSHERAILSLTQTAGIPVRTVNLLDAIRRKRNQSNYERAGITSAAEAAELHEIVVALRSDVVRWLRDNHRALCPRGITA